MKIETKITGDRLNWLGALEKEKGDNYECNNGYQQRQTAAHEQNHHHRDHRRGHAGPSVCVLGGAAAETGADT